VKRFINSVKNQLLILFFSLWHRVVKKESPERYGKARILIVTTTALGDTLWATPALRALRSTYPEAFIGVLTSPIGFSILKNQPGINTLFLLPDQLLLSFFSLRKKLLACHFDTILVFHASQRLILPLSASLGASRIIGTKGLNKGLDALLTEAIAWKKGHEIERRMDLIRRVDADGADLSLSYIPTAEEKRAAEKLLEQHQIDLSQTIIALHPGAKDHYKCWPKEHFMALGKGLKKELSCQILITGGPDEASLAQEVAAAIPGAVSFSEPLPFRAFAAVLARMALVIANDTGPMHLALAMQVPVVALFAPTDPAVCGPLHAAKVALIAKPRTCTPCLRRKCRDPFCLLQIAPEEALHEALKLLLKK